MASSQQWRKFVLDKLFSKLVFNILHTIHGKKNICTGKHIQHVNKNNVILNKNWEKIGKKLNKRQTLNLFIVFIRTLFCFLN
jgi:hypothetical protein